MNIKMRTALTIVLAFLSLLAVAGCSKRGNDGGDAAAQGEESPLLRHWDEGGSADSLQLVSGEDGVLIRDNQGIEVPVRRYGKIVLTSAGAIEILYSIGGQSSIAAIGEARGGIWPQEQTAALPGVGNLARPNFETIISFEPDLVILNGMNVDEALNLNNVGIPAIIHNADTIVDIFNSVLILGALTGRETQAEQLVASRKNQLAAIQAELAEKPLNLKGAFVYSANPMMAFRDDSLPGEILSLLGVTNIASGLSTERPILTPEYILAENPDFIFGAMSVQSVDDIISANPMIRKVRAGQDGLITIVPSHLILRPTPRVIDALQTLYDQLSQLK
jgi:iron complex transport system substrate-binding protein